MSDSLLTGPATAGNPTTDRVAVQRAFVGLLARPLVTPTSAPEAHRQITRNFKEVADAARRLGYRVATVGRAVRLVRVPAAGVVTAPPPPLDQPSRRILALTCVLAAACEEAGGGATLAKLSELVGQLTSTNAGTVSSYDQGVQSHRRQLLHASKMLEYWGVLHRRTFDERLLDEWTDGRGGIGAGYDIDRDALLLLTSPDVLTQALNPAPEPDQVSSTSTLRALRALIETPALLYSELSPADANALRATRGLRSSEAAALTGGHVEARSEGLVLLLPDDPASPITVDWPRSTVASWVALLMADLASGTGRRQEDGTVVLADAEVDDLAEELFASRGGYLNKALREDPTRIRPTAEAQLRHLGLLRIPESGGWILSPVAGRYRDPAVMLSEAAGNPEEGQCS